MSKLRDYYDQKYISFSLWFAAMNHRKRFSTLAKQAEPIESFNKKYRDIVVPYWKQYGINPGKNWYRACWASNKDLSPKYIPNDLWLQEILPYYNTVLYTKGALQDKCLHNLYLPNVKRPETICKNVSTIFYDDELNCISREEAIKRCRENDDFIVKPSVGTSQGFGIEFYSGTQMTDEEVEEMLDKYDRNFIVQKIVRQHANLAALNASSLNTIRVISFFYKGEVHILSAILRVGGKTSRIDNVAQGGYQCTINPDGTLKKLAYAYREGKALLVSETEDGIIFEGFNVPAYKNIVEIINACAPKMGHFKILGWDFAVNQDEEPIMIEYNTLPGQNQMTCGPTFGELTDEVLNEVFGKVECN